MKKNFLILALFITCIYQAVAQDSAKNGKLVITGSVDAYYRYNFHNAKDSMRTNNLTSFTNSQNSFEIGMASLKADYTMGKVEAVADLGFGKRAEEFSYNDRGTLAAIKQAYISYSPSEKVKFTIGKWFTHVGYEVPDAYMNRNYSMDYLFSYGPFFHTGLKMDVTATNNFSFMVGISNPTDFTTASFQKKFFIAQLHGITTNSKFNGYLNYVGGKDVNNNSVNQVDLVVSTTISDQFSIGYNAALKTVKPLSGKSNSWWGSAIYLNYDPLHVFGLTARGEYFSDKNAVAGPSTNLYDITLSGNIRVDNLTIIPEFRVDGAKDPLFYKNTDQNSPMARTTASFILAAIFHF